MPVARAYAFAIAPDGAVIATSPMPEADSPTLGMMMICTFFGKSAIFANVYCL